MSPTELPKRIGVALVRGYQITLSPFLGRQCRFYPTCSDYALEAIRRHGLLLGGGLALRRLSRCHPFHAGGVDLVPLETGARAIGGRAGGKES